MFDNVLNDKDVVQKLTRGKISGEELWNELAKRKFHRVLNIMFEVGKQGYRRKRKVIANTLTEYIRNINPNMVISVIPLVNNALIDACQRLNKPFLLIPTDLDPVY